MKTISKSHGRAGIMLIECLVYIAVFTVLTGAAMASFYFCWDYTKALHYATDDVEAALRAGEGWRADVRAATGQITVEKTATGEAVRMIEPKQVVVYRWAGGELTREIPAQNYSRVLLARVKTSEMQADQRGDVTAWRWEVELSSRRPQMHLPLVFTFEAVPNKS